jgi:hypothetical protein
MMIANRYVDILGDSINSIDLQLAFTYVTWLSGMLDSTVYFMSHSIVTLNTDLRLGSSMHGSINLAY